jgi:hypothetical protein
MADRGLCSICGGNYAVAKDGTPYSHSSTEGDPCPGADQPIAVKSDDAKWIVYGGEVTQVTFPVQIVGPNPTASEVEFANTGQMLPILAEFDHSPTQEEINGLLPEQYRIPGPGVSEAPQDEA